MTVDIVSFGYGPAPTVDMVFDLRALLISR
ncbi:hypothetical protein QFZ49_005119 [Streptomyces turgidiscabies]|uniref:Uncharacterized protein n=1 Tax=Streptomyces turgidiscabies TaxID=85558 RepID=A0ABU0RTN0_9ACTN|nr:hypothetical protein [Streptomyces turgidiscabies]